LPKKVAIILGYFTLSKNHNEPPKVAQLAKKLPNLVTLKPNKVERFAFSFHSRPIKMFQNLFRKFF
jgi:hypothetical protein